MDKGKMIQQSIDKLISYMSENEFKGYDPYDTLNSWIPFRKIHRVLPAYSIQAGKYNPINIRPLLGIANGLNPKGMGLLLKSFCMLYEQEEKKEYLEKAKLIFNWLKTNPSHGNSGVSWGYNFDWATPGDYLPAYTPSVVVTSFVVNGMWEYYQVTQDPEAVSLITRAADWIRAEIPISQFPEGVSYAYTVQSKGACYNASLLAAEVLVKADKLGGTQKYTKSINNAIDFILSKQRLDGEWWYSYDPESGNERKQIDFHQGFILMSLKSLNELLPQPRTDVSRALVKGLEYYRENQFFDNGQSLWRIPKKWPVDIHNQSQGIITLSGLCCETDQHLKFAHKIAEWTIQNMQDPKGYFYYRKFSWYINKIPYMRWSQAWMLLALVTLKGKLSERQ